MVGLSGGENLFIQGGIAQDLRSDGRKRLTYRPIRVETGLIPQGRGGEELSTKLSATLHRCLLGGKSGAGAGIDFSSLSVVEGKVCWDLYIDGIVVSSDGNLLDALGAAVKEDLLALLRDEDDPKDSVIQTKISDEDLDRVLDRIDLLVGTSNEDGEPNATHSLFTISGPGVECGDANCQWRHALQHQQLLFV